MFLWQGVGPTVVGYFFEGALKIGVYELVKCVPFGACVPSPLGAFLDSSVAARFVVAGAASGLVAAAVLCPVEDARIRMVADPSYGRAYECRGPQRHGLRHVGNQGTADLEASCCEVDLSLVEMGAIKTSLKLYEEEGIQGAFSGLPAMLLKQVPYTVTKQCTFDLLCATGFAALAAQASRAAAAAAAAATTTGGGVGCAAAAAVATVGMQSHTAVVLAAAAVSSVVSALASQPGDVLLTAHYKDVGPHKASLRSLVQGGGGVGALFAGTKARLLHVGLLNTVQLVVYDYARGLFGI
jgi:solute carrier family 25 phosphate transporter 3